MSDQTELILSQTPWMNDAGFIDESLANPNNPLMNEAGSMSAKAARGILAVTVVTGLGLAASGPMDSLLGQQQAHTVELNVPVNVASWSNYLLSTDGINPDGTESSYSISGHGSCSPYTQTDGLNALRGTFKPTEDMKDVEFAFLGQNTEFANNMALTGESRNASIYDVFSLPKPSAKPEKAGQVLADVFENQYFVSARLAENTSIVNTFCDKQGVVHTLGVRELPAGTLVAGAMIDKQITAPDGKVFTVFKNGKTVELQPDALVVDVKLADGTIAKMYATNKAGVNTDDDAESEVACENLINAAPPINTETTPSVPESTTSTTRGRTTTTPHNSTTSTTRGRTSTTRKPTTTVTNGTVPPPPGPGPTEGGPPPKEAKPTPDQHATSSTTFTTSPGETVDPHNAQPTTSTTSVATTSTTTPGSSSPSAPTTTTTISAGSTSTTSQAPSTTMAPVPG